MNAEQVEHYRNFLRVMGIAEPEIQRSIDAMINYPTPEANSDFAITGIDLAGDQPLFKVPDTGSPPIFQPNHLDLGWIPSVGQGGYMTQPTPDPLGSVKTNDPQYDPNGSNLGHTYNLSNNPASPSSNWLGLASDPNSEPPKVGIEGFNSDKAIPEWRYPVEDSQILFPPDFVAIPPSDGYPIHEVEEIDLVRYVYTGHDNDDPCKPFNGRMFDFNDTVHRPVVPSEGRGYTTQHPNCKCYYVSQKSTKKKLSKATKKEQKVITAIKRDINRKAKKHELHTVFEDGHLSKRTRGTSPIHEALMEVRNEFGWLSDDYLLNAKSVAESQGGQLYLIRGASESITDHRGEGEPYRRLLKGDELASLARTAINKGMDINHNPEWRTSASVLDSEYDPQSKSIQMIVMEKDPEIIQAIANGQITAVSINGGSPRSESVEPCINGCTDNTCELCTVPRGVVLGEMDDIAMTWVATQPLFWKGIKIDKAEPGIKITAIQPI